MSIERLADFCSDSILQRRTAVIIVLQRVTHSKVIVDNTIIAAIDVGLLALVCAEPTDDQSSIDWLANKVCKIRVFSDSHGKMGLSLLDSPTVQLLLVPQFTLAASFLRGNRPSFSSAAQPELGRQWFAALQQACAKILNRPVSCGEFGANMHVELCNQGPATFILSSPR